VSNIGESGSAGDFNERGAGLLAMPAPAPMVPWKSVLDIPLSVVQLPLLLCVCLCPLPLPIPFPLVLGVQMTFDGVLGREFGLLPGDTAMG